MGINECVSKEPGLSGVEGANPERRRRALRCMVFVFPQLARTVMDLLQYFRCEKLNVGALFRILSVQEIERKVA